MLIFDEVFVGFRIALGGAQEYFGVRADMVTYGKTLGGGLPVGVLCGRKDLMRRFRDDRPADICFARGTFNSHPYVMAAMDEFLRRLETPEIRCLYGDLDELWNERAARLNERLREAGVPVQVANLSSIWTVLYTQPSRYNWMLQYYLRAEGLALSWIGTGRLIFSLNYTAGRFRRGRGPLRRRREGDAAGRLVVGRSCRNEQVDPARDPAGDPRASAVAETRLREAQALRGCSSSSSSSSMIAMLRMARIDQLAAQQRERRLVVELDVVERVGEDLGHPDQARSARP